MLTAVDAKDGTRKAAAQEAAQEAAGPDDTEGAEGAATRGSSSAREQHLQCA